MISRKSAARAADRSRRPSASNPCGHRRDGHSASIRPDGGRAPGDRPANPLRGARPDQCGNDAEPDQNGWSEPSTRLGAFAVDDLVETPHPTDEQDHGSTSGEPAEHIAERRGRGTQLAGETNVSGQRLDGALQALDAIVLAADLP